MRGKLEIRASGKQPRGCVTDESEDQDRKYEFWRGIGIGLLLHVWQIPLAMMTATISFSLIGVFQLMYITPAIRTYHRRGRFKVVKGLILAAFITFSLNVAVIAMLLISLINSH